ncbi:MAG: HlyC/CorC family transporter, partial [Lachnospiraceae bacterium]
MDSGEAIQLISLVILLMLSAFFSSAETALTTVNKIRMRKLSEEGDARARTVLRITDNSGKMLSAILIGNNIVNISASSIATTLAIDLLGSKGAGIATGILTLLILVFGEISPKTIATIHADSISLAYARTIDVLMKILTPVIFAVNQIAMLFLKILRIDPNGDHNAMTEEELRTIVDVSHETGVIETEEKEMINNLFDFGDAQAKEVMVPRIDMTFASVESTYEELIEIFREDKFTRLPVYEDTTDNVIGIINMKDLLLYDDKEGFRVRDILRKPYYTYEHKNTADLFMDMRSSSISVAIVLDEYGATAGLITLEDLLEEIVGEIRDEYDTDEEDPVVWLGDREYEILGSQNLEDLCEELGLKFESKDYDSIGGYVIGLLDHFPKEGESIVTEDGVEMIVESMDK